MTASVAADSIVPRRMQHDASKHGVGAPAPEPSSVRSKASAVTNSQLDDLEAVRKVTDALAGFEALDQERILRWSRERLGLVAGGQGGGTTPRAPEDEGVQGAGPRPARSSADIKSFVEAKNPASDTQFAATVAYYYQFEAPEHLRKESINAEDLQEACRLVGRSRLTRPAQTLIHALTQGFVDRGDRGHYTINTVGENLVAMALPADAGRAPAKRAIRRPKQKGPARRAPRAKSARR